jgi:hypothetical protein
VPTITSFAALTALMVLAGASQAHAGDWPAVSTNVVPLAGEGLTNEGCRNHALEVMSGDLSLNHIRVAGENTTAAVVTIQGHDYSILVRCQVEHQIVFLAVSGYAVQDAHKAMILFQQGWAGQPQAARAAKPKPAPEPDVPPSKPAIAQGPLVSTSLFVLVGLVGAQLAARGLRRKRRPGPRQLG